MSSNRGGPWLRVAVWLHKSESVSAALAAAAYRLKMSALSETKASLYKCILPNIMSFSVAGPTLKNTLPDSLCEPGCWVWTFYAEPENASLCLTLETWAH